ncbi:MAG: hypothetical protein ACRDWT_19035 [Jatrophihabitantaceae bacterium]
MSEPIRVRGDATAEEVVAVLAALNRNASPEELAGYELWRARRIRALRAGSLSVRRSRGW